MNYQIQLNENREAGNKLKAIVSLKRLNQLEDLKKSGGFLRYEIDLEDQSTEKATAKTKINLFLTQLGITETI